MRVNYIVGDGPHGGHFTKFFLKDEILRCVSCYNYCQIMDWIYNMINVLSYHEVVKCWDPLIECSTLIIYPFPKFVVWCVYWLRFCFQTFVIPLGFSPLIPSCTLKYSHASIVNTFLMASIIWLHMYLWKFSCITTTRFVCAQVDMTCLAKLMHNVYVGFF